MSGGIAYVLDEAGDFARKCNMSMVELESVPAELSVAEREFHETNDLSHIDHVRIGSDMTRHDERRLHHLVSQHAKLTGSERARTILADWNAVLPKFKKVMPVEYRRALSELISDVEEEAPAMALAGE